MSKTETFCLYVTSPEGNEIKRKEEEIYRQLKIIIKNFSLMS